jgi:DUF4097 and DUF4098 domain-containing protein YvlB
MANGTVYRRGSVFGALLLIAIGALFLYANLNPDFTAWPFIAKYWPVLIIFWGLSKLSDYLMLRGTPQAAAAARVTGGDIVGLVFLIIIGMLFTAAVEHGWPHGPMIRIGDEEMGCLFGTEYEFTDELEQEMTSGSKLTFANLRGDATFSPAAGDHFHLLAHKTVCAPSETEARRRAERIVPTLKETGGEYDFRWEVPSGTSGLLSVDMEVQVPKQINVDITGRNGDARVSDLTGLVSLTWEHGDASVNTITGPVSVAIRSGSVNLEGIDGTAGVEGRGDEVDFRNVSGSATLEGEFYGPIQFSAIQGPASFTSRRTNFHATRIDGEMTVDGDNLTLRGAAGDVTLFTRNKEIEMDGTGGAIRIENRNGRVVIRAPQPPSQAIEVQNERGNIELVLPAGSSVQLSATARRGEVESEFEGLTREEQPGGNESLSGALGGGRTSIRLNTTYGTISVRRTG